MRATGRAVKGLQARPGERFWRLDEEVVLEVGSGDPLEDTFGATNTLY